MTIWAKHSKRTCCHLKTVWTTVCLWLLKSLHHFCSVTKSTVQNRCPQNSQNPKDSMTCAAVGMTIRSLLALKREACKLSKTIAGKNKGSKRDQEGKTKTKKPSMPISVMYKEGNTKLEKGKTGEGRKRRKRCHGWFGDRDLLCGICCHSESFAVRKEKE